MHRSHPARTLRLVSTLVFVGTSGGLAAGQAIEQEYVTPNLGTSTQVFGWSVATEGDLMVAGSPGDDFHGNDAGAAFVYRWNSTTQDWGFEAQLFASDPEADALFGIATACWDDVVVVGARQEDNANGADAGAAYVFRRDPVTGNWAEEQKLIGAGASDQFGTRVKLRDQVLLVSSPYADTAQGVDAGAVDVYRWIDPIAKWTAEARLLDAQGAADDHAGLGMDFDATTVVIGSPGAGNTNDTGAVQVWTVSGTTWSWDATLTAASPKNYAAFGFACAVSGDDILVGAPGFDVGTRAGAGACYFFSKATGSWTQAANFDNPTPESGDAFGACVAIRGKLAVAAASYDKVLARLEAGTARTFRKGKGAKGWFLDQALAASDAGAFDYFGNSVGLGDEHLVFGAPFNNTGSGVDWGVVYGFDVDEINVTLDPPDPAPGGTIHVSIHDGRPNDLVLLVIDEVDGVPTWIEAVVGTFGSDHRFAFDADVENPLLGVNVGVTAWKVSPTGALVSSERVFADV